ncbi:MAG TPA: hypothetical protein VNJ49_11220 [Bradyrhizobium sp.]|nr:hypothetical protein [Bradyrhizobium sp.]
MRIVFVGRRIARARSEHGFPHPLFLLTQRQAGASGRKRRGLRRLRLGLRLRLRLLARRRRVGNLQRRRQRSVVDAAVIDGGRADRERTEIAQLRLDRRAARRIGRDFGRPRRIPDEIARRIVERGECLQHSLRGQIEDEVGAAVDDLLGHREFQIAEHPRCRIGLVERAGDGKGFLVEPLDAARRGGAFAVDRKAHPVELDLAAVDAGARFGVDVIAQPLQLVAVVRAVIEAIDDAFNVAPLAGGVGELFGIAVGLTVAFDDDLAAIQPVRPGLRRGLPGRSRKRQAQQGTGGGKRAPAQARRSLTPRAHHPCAIHASPQTGGALPAHKSSRRKRGPPVMT